MRFRRDFLLVALAWLCAALPVYAAEREKHATENAIASSLQWLAAQQRDDGGWAFDGKEMPVGSSTEATGLVLLAFLEAGQTHKEGKYKDEVRRGLAYLIVKIKVDGEVGDLREASGDMVVHAIAACALLEAYATTHDKELLAPSQMTASFIAKAQDEKTGGWRRHAKSPPSMLACGWQLLALKRAHMAYLQVPRETVARATKYLDHAQLSDGSHYAERDGDPERRATAVGLFARVSLGWKRSNPELIEGLEFVGSDPHPHDAMHNFFAHQLHYGASPKAWPSWHAALRKQLLQSQQTAGDDAGSWFDADDREAARGRLYQTTINSILLSMYSRGPLPIRPVPDDEEDFPL